MSTGKCAVMQDDRVLAMLDAELFFEDGSVISCLTSDHANNIYSGAPTAQRWRRSRAAVRDWTARSL